VPVLEVARRVCEFSTGLWKNLWKTILEGLEVILERLSTPCVTLGELAQNSLTFERWRA
jgi:hypothetical protein